MLESNIIILRKLELNDFDNYLDYVTDEEISKQFNFNYNEESAKLRLIELFNKYEQENKPVVWAIVLKSTYEFVGMITIDFISYTNKRFSLSYGIREKYRGNSYAYLASVILIDFMFNNFDMHRLELAHNVDNIASKKIIKKLGAKLEGIARESKFYNNEFIDRKIYSILKQEWIKSKKTKGDIKCK